MCFDCKIYEQNLNQFIQLFISLNLLRLKCSFHWLEIFLKFYILEYDLNFNLISVKSVLQSILQISFNTTIANVDFAVSF